MVNTTSFSRAKGGKGKRSYKRKLENGPKRPLSAYNFFFRSERERILAQCEGITINKQTTKKGKRAHRKSHGAINFSDMGKRIAAAWKVLDEEGRAPYVAEAAQDMKRYQEAKEAAQQQLTVADPPSKNNIESEKRASQSKKQNSDVALNNMATQVQTIQLHSNSGQPTNLSNDISDLLQTEKEFSPTDPTKNDGTSPSAAATTTTQDYAFQCEVCCTAIFATYDECLQHEQKCTESKTQAQRNEAEIVV